MLGAKQLVNRTSAGAVTFPRRLSLRSVSRVRNLRVRAEAPPGSSSPPVPAAPPVPTDQERAASALRQATLGLSSMTEKLRERIETLEDQLERARRSRATAEEMRGALEAEAQEVGQLAVQATEARNATQAKLIAQNDVVARLQNEVSTLERLAETTRARAEAAAAAALEPILPAAIIDGTAVTDAPADLQQDGPTASTSGSSLAAAAALSAATAGSTDGEPSPSLEQTLSQLEGARQRLSEAKDRARILSQRLEAMASAASNAEEMAAAAMKAAEAAVADEMEKLSGVQRLDLEVEKARRDLEKMLSALLKATGGIESEAVTSDVAAAAPAAAAAAPDAPAAAAMPAAAAAPTMTPRSSSSPVPPPGMESGAEVTLSTSAKLMQFVSQYKWVLLAAAVAVFAISTGPNGPIATALAAPLKLLGVAQVRAMEYIATLGLPHIDPGMVDVLWLLATAIVTVPLICKIPGGSPILGFLLGGALLGPHSLGLITNLGIVHHMAELGVVFLMFNIGLELSLERLMAMGKYVFGLGTAQVVFTLAAIGAAIGALAVPPVSGGAAIIIGASLALSSTAVALQVLQDRGESSSRHGRATFSVLLLQDLAVVVILMLIPLLAPGAGGSAGGTNMAALGAALAAAAIKAVACIGVIMVGGRSLVRPLFKKIAALHNPELFAATTLLVCLGTSVLTQVAGLSMALGAFLGGLVIAETEFALQVESDIAPYKGLLLGLFFMTVGMEISPNLLITQWPTILAGIVALLGGKVLIMLGLGPMFGLSRLQSIRAGLYLAPGGEFAFVALGDAVAKGLFAQALCSKLFLVVALSMALTPYLAVFGAKLGAMFELSDVKALQPTTNESDDLRGHVIICGFGRSGQLVAQLLSERLIPFVALDVRADRVQAGRGQDLRVYFGDAGNRDILHKVATERAACAVVTLDSPGANYRAVWALTKHFPGVKIFARAHDINHGLNLEKAGATAVVPETLEPSLQLAASVLGQLDMPPEEIAVTIDEFRRSHLKELMEVSVQEGTSLGYGLSHSLVSRAAAGAAVPMPAALPPVVASTVATP